MTKRTEKQNRIFPWRVKDFLGLLCRIGVCGFLFVFAACYSFYAPDGYYVRMVTNRFLLFRFMCLFAAAFMIPLAFCYCALPLDGETRDWRKRLQTAMDNLSLTDLCVIFFAWANLVSYLSSDYKEVALWGEYKWYMGFIVHLFFVGIYFFVSRFCDDGKKILLLFMAVTAVQFLWGILNRFSVFPVKPVLSDEWWISSIGNIDWFCGYWSVFFSIGIVLYLVTDRKWLRIVSGIHAALSVGAGVMAGADSAFVSMGAVFLFLLPVAFQKDNHMKRFLECGILFCGTCQLLRLIAALYPESLNMHTFLMDLMLGNLTLAALLFLLCLRFFMGKQMNYSERQKGDTAVCGEWVRNFRWIGYAGIGLAIGILLLYLLLLVINTKAPGSIGPLSRYPAVFLFDENWGSKRGVSLRIGMYAFQSLSGVGKLFGVGPDCFTAYTYSVPEWNFKLLQAYGDNYYLTCAHNECITYLVNNGVMGFGMWVGMFASSFVRLIKRAGREPFCYVFAASLLSYFFHNQFSFSQIMSTPYIFMMMGIGERFMRGA